VASKKPSSQVQSVSDALDERGVEYDGEPPPKDLSPGRLTAEWKRIQLYKSQLDREKRNVAKEREGFEAAQSELAETRKKVDEELEGLQSDREDLKRDRESVAEDAKQLAERERLVTRREEEARTGFARLNDEVLESLRDRREEIESEIEAREAAARSAAEDARAALREELEQARAQAHEQLRGTRDRLQQEADQLAADRLELTRRARELDDQEQLLALERDLAEKKLAQDVELRTADAVAEADHYKQLLVQIERQRDVLSERTARAEANLQRLGGDPEGYIEEVDALRGENRELRDSLAARPSPEMAEQLRARLEELEAAAKELPALRRRESQLETEVRRHNIDAGKVQLLEDEREALEHQKLALRAAVHDLQEQLGELRQLDEAKLPFATCSAVDDDSELQRPVRTTPSVELAELVQRVQGHMAGRGFHYQELDLQLFVAGLATSRLHLLQGLSGTGKTSLPVRFAQAIGADVEVIEVQAGWRDRDDLLGYYNAFEGRFHETGFTQALYRAGSPRWAELPLFVVLDEMNLSHPEQYFSTMLSKLELAGSAEPVIELVDRPIDHAPRRFIDDRSLPWPENVWFIGTANHDETTVSFADKTYDRAHVQELPPQHQPVRSAVTWDGPPLSTAALHAAFADAVAEWGHAGKKTAAHFRSQLAPVFARLGVSWGNRIDGQLERFVPVAMAAGALPGAAADHVLATKIVRKVRDRHDLLPEALEQLREAIASRWGSIDAAPPSSTLKILDEEIRRLRGDVEDLAAEG
jgi:hypothetical protein